MPDIVIYGKVIIDDLLDPDGAIVRGLLGGGGPQAAFGARLWADSVGLLARIGPDLEDRHRDHLRGLDVDLDGITVVSDAVTIRSPLPRDKITAAARAENWARIMSTPVDLPASYVRPKAIHLITEYADEPMVADAVELRRAGSMLSLEPLIDVDGLSNAEEILRLLRHVDIVTPDWPSASGIAGTEDPRQVLRYWSRTGPELVAIRHSEHGSYLWSRAAGRGWHIPAVPVATVVDRTGAGNSYGGGLCAGWLLTGDPIRAAIHAAVSASFMIEHIGMPTGPARHRDNAAGRHGATLHLVAEMI